MKQRLSKYWKAFANIATIFSFAVNFVLVLVLLLALSLLFRAKNEVLEPLLENLDQAFLGLGQTSVETTVEVDQTIPISFTLPMSQSLGLDFNLPINQQTEVVLVRPVPLNVPATFVLPGWGGAINGNVSLQLPTGMRLPVQLTMNVPVRAEIPVILDVPVNEQVPIQMVIDVNIQLGEAGLDPAVERLRGVFTPLRLALEQIPSSLSEIIR